MVAKTLPKKVEQRVGKGFTMSTGQILSYLLIELALKDLFGLSAVHVGRFALRVTQRAEHLLEKRACDEILKRLPNLQLALGGGDSLGCVRRNLCPL